MDVARGITPEVIEGLRSAVERLAVGEGEMVLAAKDTRRTKKREESPVIIPTSEEDLATATDTSEEERRREKRREVRKRERAAGIRSRGTQHEKQRKRKAESTRKPQSLDAMIRKLRISVCVVKAATMEPALRDLLLNYLIQDALEAGATIPLPEGLKMEKLSLAEYRGDRYALR